MFNNVYQKVPRAVRQWFENALIATGPVPVPIPARVRIDEAERHRPTSIPEYRIFKQRRKR